MSSPSGEEALINGYRVRVFVSNISNESKVTFSHQNGQQVENPAAAGSSRSRKRSFVTVERPNTRSYKVCLHPAVDSPETPSRAYNLRKIKRKGTSNGHEDQVFIVGGGQYEEDETTDEIDTEEEEQGGSRSKRGKRTAVDKTKLFRQAQSPLELSYLLDKIIDYLPLKDWKACRKVNTLWKSVCDNQLEKFLINIGNSSNLKALVTQTAWENEEGRQSTFANVKLPLNVELSDPSLQTFLSTSGSNIKSLLIPTMKWGANDLHKVISELCPNLEEIKFMGDVPTTSQDRIIDSNPDLSLPKLKSLSFYISNSDANLPIPIAPHILGFFNSATNGWTKRIVSDLLSLCPNLEEVRCYNRRSIVEDPSLCHRIGAETQRLETDVETSFTRVNQFLAQKLFSRAHDCNPKLKNLNMYLRLNSRGLEKLEMKKYPLQSLDLHVKVEDQTSMISLLTSLGKTLRHLRLKVDIRLLITTRCEFLSELETLHLEDYTGSLLFLQDIPKLKTLTLERFDCRRFIFEENLPSLINSKIKSLSIEHLRNPEKQGKCIKKMAVFLPNVNRLSLNPATDNDLLRIFDSMQNLEHLQLTTAAVTNNSQTSISNSGLCGFTDADVENILDNGYEQNRHAEYEKLRRMPYIGDLKRLKSLELLGDLGKLTPNCVKNRMICGMHGLWVMHGIGNLKDLGSLTIHNATVSSLELKYIVKSMNLSRLQLINCRTDINAERWARKKLFDKPIDFTLTQRGSTAR